MAEDKKLISSLAKSEDAEVKTAEEQEDLHGENLNDRVRVLSPGMMVAKRFFRSKLSVIGLTILVILFLFSFLGPVFSPWHDGGERVKDDSPSEIIVYSRIDYVIDGEEYSAFDISSSTSTYNSRADMSLDHFLGTDTYGYDLFTDLMLGGRVSLTIGFVVIFLEAIIGIVLGGLSGFFGGWVDNLIMRIVDILSCIPSLPIMLILSVILDELGVTGMGRLYYLMGVLTLIGWTGIARIVRGQILSLREQEFMLAAKCAGLSTRRKIFKHLLPNVMPQLIVSMTMGLGSIILTEATLGYLGLGAPLGTPTWGSMINAANNSILMQDYPNFWLPPGICITLAILAFNFVGDGLRDAFDPKMKR